MSAEDLRLLGLTPGGDFSPDDIRRAFHAQVRTKHPDKGGLHYYYKQQENSRQRHEDIKKGIDRRDQQSRHRPDMCTTCEKNAGITKIHAESDGLNWKEYTGHPDELKTCWACKANQASVMTRKRAESKFMVLTEDYALPDDNKVKSFGKKYKGKTYSQIYHFDLPYCMWALNAGGPFCEGLRRFRYWLRKKSLFLTLRNQGRSFHHCPQDEALTRDSEYFWVADLERLARQRGWEPRARSPKDSSAPRPSDEVPQERANKAEQGGVMPKEGTKKATGARTFTRADPTTPQVPRESPGHEEGVGSKRKRLDFEDKEGL